MLFFLTTFASVVVPVVLVALLFTPFRRCVLIGPIALAALVGGYITWEALWKATGGKYGECTDVCFEPHIPGSAPAAFAPLWTLTLIAIVGVVVGISILLVRSSLDQMATRPTGRTTHGRRSA
jgi:hypothetical protein